MEATVMDCRSSLREQAAILRGVADSQDLPVFRTELLALAKKCEGLAKSEEDDPVPDRLAELKPRRNAK
jgi:hypothetical protein